MAKIIVMERNPPAPEGEQPNLVAINVEAIMEVMPLGDDATTIVYLGGFKSNVVGSFVTVVNSLAGYKEKS